MFNLEDILSKFPVFSTLNKKSISQLAGISVLREFKKGQPIYREKDSPGNLYIVVSGRVKTYTQASLREGRILEYLYKGTCFGIISLLTDEPHSVTAEAANDSLIIEIPKDKFIEFLKGHSLLALEFSKILSRRVKKRADKDKNIFESTVISVYSRVKRAGRTTYSLVLSKALHEESGKKVIVIEFRKDSRGFSLVKQAKILGIGSFNEAVLDKFLVRKWGFDYLGVSLRASSESSRAMPLLLSFLTQFYNFIILDCPGPDSRLAELFLLQSDFIHLLFCREPDCSSEITRTVNFLEGGLRIKRDKIKLILRETYSDSHVTKSRIYTRRGKPTGISSKYRIVATLPFLEDEDFRDVIAGYPDTLYAKALRRLAREISSVRIGLALGSGAAFGFAHIGVLKVLEENKLDVDITSGSSMGSVIAALWAAGNGWRQIRDFVCRFKDFPVFSFLDIGFSGKAFLKGRNLRKLLRDFFGDMTFNELKRPVLIVAFDFRRRNSRILSGGNLLIRQAVLASCSMPGIFEPVKTKDDLLLDGGVLNPLPVGCLVKEGVKKIVSVNVTPSIEEIERAYRGGKKGVSYNVFDFIFGSIEAMQREFIHEAVSLSDVVIHPKLEDAMWTDFGKVDYFIERGEQEALKCVDKIKQLQEI